MNALPLQTRTVSGWKILCVSHNPSPPSAEPRGVFLQSLAGEACEGLVAKAREVWVFSGVPASHPLRLPSGFAPAPLSECSHHLVACFSQLRVTRILRDESVSQVWWQLSLRPQVSGRSEKVAGFSFCPPLSCKDRNDFPALHMSELKTEVFDKCLNVKGEFFIMYVNPKRF